jgi:hypothetical protein
MGNLDPGPVIGGYLGALLLSAAYLSIGMCVSAGTDNQIVAFVGTAFLCAIAYAIGGDGTSALGRALGTGARFESVARGVLDLRDLAYYGPTTAASPSSASRSTCCSWAGSRGAAVPGPAAAGSARSSASS